MGSDSDREALSHTIASSSTLQLAALARDSRYYSSVGERFDRITRIAAKLLNAPATAVTLFHHEAEWFKSVRGWQVTSLPIKEGLGYIAAEATEPVIIGDTAADQN